MRAFRMIAACLSVLLPIIGCEESGPTQNTKAVGWKIADFTGTYRLIHYIVQYDDKTGFSDQTPGVTINGQMTISDKGVIQQTFNYTQNISDRFHLENTLTHTGNITQIKNDSILVISSPDVTRDAHYTYNKFDLMFKFDGVSSAGRGYTLTENWNKTSVSAKAKAGQAKTSRIDKPVLPMADGRKR